MNKPREFTYIIQKNDNLYHLSERFATTVQSILNHNPFINPYDLKSGTAITVYGRNCETVIPESAPENTVAPENMQEIPSGMGTDGGLYADMRLAWLQHVYWTRMLLISIAERLDDQNEVSNRVLQNPKDIADIFARYYNRDAASAIEKLLTEHLVTGAGIITALRDGETETAQALNEKWYKNADEMAAAFAGINPYYKRDDLQNMLHRHLDLTTEEVSARLAKKYNTDIGAFGEVEKEALMMADYFAENIKKQFPNM